MYLQDYILSNIREVDLTRSRYLTGIMNFEKCKPEHSMFKEAEDLAQFEKEVADKKLRGTLVAYIPEKIALFYECNGVNLDEHPDTRFSHIVIIKNAEYYEEIVKQIKNSSYKVNFVFYPNI